MNTSRCVIVVLVALATVLVVGSARPATAPIQLTGNVGPGFSITLKDSQGKGVTQLDPGVYDITVTDRTPEHNFHLTGPGIAADQYVTSVDNATTETVHWNNVTLVDGKYTYLCDVHPSLKGTVQVGPPPPPPPTVPKLTARVGPGKTISLKRGGSLVKSLVMGTYKVVVRDSSKTDNFHLIAPGVNKRTAVRGRASVTWKVRFKLGKGSYRSDAHKKKLRRAFKVMAPPISPPPPPPR
jgi:hypothetical protein